MLVHAGGELCPGWEGGGPKANHALTADKNISINESINLGMEF